MIGSCPECNGKLSSEAAACPHCGYVPKPETATAPHSTKPEPDRISCPSCGQSIVATASICRFCKATIKAAAAAPPAVPPPNAVKSGALSLDPKRNIRQLLVLGCVVGCLVVGWLVFRFVSQAGNRGPSSSPFGGFTGPKVLIEETQQVTDATVVYYQFRLDKTSNLTLEMDVTQGEGATVYLLNADEYKKFEDAKKSLWGGQFKHYQAMAAENKKQHRAYGALGPGSYVLTLMEGSSPNILGGPDVAMVRVKLTAQ